jgi:hypothetical protein
MQSLHAAAANTVQSRQSFANFPTHLSFSLVTTFNGTVSQDFLLQVSFHESPSPKPLKIRGDIHKSRCTTGVNDTGGKFVTGVNDTGGKIAAGVNDTGGTR